MRLLRALLILLLVLVAAITAAAWLVLPRLDMNQFREDLANEASVRLGRTVSIDGPITLRVLPEPMLTAGKIAIGSGEGIAMTAAEMRLRLSLGSLLEGRIDARELVLRGADLKLPWPIDPANLMVRTPPWLSSLSASVEDGRLSVGDMQVTGIDATLTTVGYGGSYAVAGTAALSGRPWRFTARLTQPGLDGSAGLDVALDGQGPLQGTGGALTGQIAPDGTLAGRVTGRGPDLSRLFPAPAVAFRAEGRVSIAGGLAAADDLAVQIAGSPARGAVALRVSPQPRLDLALAASRLDLDAWLPVLAQTGPLTLPVGIDLSAEAATVAGGTLRGLRAAVDLASSGAEVREARAVLPGDAMVRLAGRVTPEGSGPARSRFEGDVTVDAPALRTTLAWLDQAGVAPFGTLPGGVLRSASLAGHVVARPGEFTVGGLDGAMDGSRLTGSLTLRSGKRLVVGAGLALDRLDLDSWLPASLPPLAAIPARLAGYDVDLRLEAKQAIYRGASFAPLTLDAAAEGGKLTVRKLDAQVNGIHANASATLAEGGRLSEGRVDLQAPQAAPLAALLPDRFAFLGHRAPGLWRAAATVQVLGAGAPDNLSLKITADLADLHLEAQPTLNLARDTWTATMLARHPGAPRLAEALGASSAGAWLGDGSLSVAAQLSGAPDRWAADGFDLAAGGLRASGALLMEFTTPRPQLTGRFAADTLPLPVPDPRSSEPLPLAPLTDWDGSVKFAAKHVLAGLAPVLQDATATLALKDGVVRLEGLTARLARGSLSGVASLDTGAVPPVTRLNLSVSGAAIGEPLFDVPLDLTSGLLDASMELSAAGFAPSALLATLAGDLNLTVRDGTLIGVDLAKTTVSLAERDLRAALVGGATPFSHFTLAAQMAQGVVRIADASFVSSFGTGALAGAVNLPDGTGDLRVTLKPGAQDGPTLSVRVSGPLEEPRWTPELADFIRWRAAHPAAAP